MAQEKFTQLFKSPSLSLARAKKHIQDLEHCIIAYNKDKPYKQVKKCNKDRSQYLVVSRLVKPFPEDLECIAADAIYNLRASLDQMLHVAAKISEPHSKNFQINYDWFAFPIKKEMEKVEKWVNDHCSKGLHGNFGDILIELKPWEHEEEDSLFYWLNQAANVNKHKFLTAVQMRRGIFSGKHISGPKTLVGPNIKNFSIGGPKSNIEVNHPTIRTSGNELALYPGITRTPTKYEVEVEIDVKFKNIYGDEKFSSVARLNEISDECERALGLVINAAKSIAKN